MKRSLSRLPISRARASSTSRASSSNQPNTPSLRRSKSSLSLRRTPQSVQSSRTKILSKKKDTRPIQDKKWQANALERIQLYFQQSPEGRQYLNKGHSIRPITLKMFVELTNVILKKIDPNLDELTSSNYVELLPIHLNTLMYPGVVTASTLKTANTMHSWPHILAILAWLVELHEISMMVNVEEIIFDIPPNAPLDVQINKSQTKIIFDFFKKFNSGEETEGKQSEIIIENMYKKLYNYSEEEFENSSKIINELRAEDENLEKTLDNDQATLSALEDEYNTAKKKLDQLYESNKTEKQTKKDIISKKAELMNRNEDFKNMIIKKESAIEKLNEKVKSQPMNVIQRTNDQKEIEDLKREIALIKERKGCQMNLGDEEDLKLSKFRRKMEQIVHNYNIELMRPSLLYPELNQIALRQDKLWQPDLIESLKEMTEIKEKLLNDLEKKIRAEQDTLENLKQTKENKQHIITTINQKIQEENKKQEVLTHEYESIIKTREEAEKQKEIELNQLKQKLMKLKEVTPSVEHKLNQLKESRTKCDELKSKLYSNGADIEKLFEKIEEEIRTKQIPRYEKIRKGIIQKVDKAIAQYSSLP